MADQPTAGFRNAGWTMGALSPDTTVSVHPLRTADGAAVNGFLYRNGPSDTALCIMHPREFLATHYLIPEILQSGRSVFTQTSRSVGSDLRLEHETALLDVAAGVAFLRREGFRRLILVGNSGGSSLYGFYNEQSQLAPADRLEHTPGGRATGLRGADMPVVDGVVLIAPHPGQGVVLQNCIDPAVADEADPTATLPALDFLSASNGYRDGPGGSHYTPGFIERYRAAQTERVARLDAKARAMIADRLAARRRYKATGTPADRIAGALSPAMTVWRTDADLRCWDLSIDPSDRAVGSVWSRDPFTTNFGVVGFARFCTPEAWLSTWSGLSSRANLQRTAASIRQPCLFIEFTGDSVVFPADAERIWGAIAQPGKQRLRIRGDHHGQPLAPGEPSGRPIAGQAIRDWLAEHFG